MQTLNLKVYAITRSEQTISIYPSSHLLYFLAITHDNCISTIFLRSYAKMLNLKKIVLSILKSQRFRISRKKQICISLAL
jgi:hypothetical protein